MLLLPCNDYVSRAIFSSPRRRCSSCNSLSSPLFSLFLLQRLACLLASHPQRVGSTHAAVKVQVQLLMNACQYICMSERACACVCACKRMHAATWVRQSQACLQTNWACSPLCVYTSMYIHTYTYIFVSTSACIQCRADINTKNLSKI